MVVRVWGRADQFELVFSPVGAFWQAVVPADLKDGQYAVELYCEDDSGNRAYWTGMLYLNNSQNVRVRIEADKFKVWLTADPEAYLLGELKLVSPADIETALLEDMDVFMKPERVTVTVSSVNYLGWG